MNEQETPRNKHELTGRHYCVQCLARVDREVYLANHFLCSSCAKKGAEFPLATTPDAKAAGDKR
jgi:hypothetical protein